MLFNHHRLNSTTTTETPIAQPGRPVIPRPALTAAGRKQRAFAPDVIAPCLFLPTTKNMKIRLRTRKKTKTIKYAAVIAKPTVLGHEFTAPL